MASFGPPSVPEFPNLAAAASRAFFPPSPFLVAFQRQLCCSKNRIMEGGGSNTNFYRGSTTTLATNPSPAAQNGAGAHKGDREAAVDAELARVNKLPAHSSYAIHRIKVLNKLRHLLSIKRTTSQDEELELLFASLSI
ncbi:unnamed protein product [Urochloa decumbens]|uniref:Uncharacterized protein n=1 Tax=Urochloa decumbens TaxID=240449 RepID=A0ABC8YFA4_9POAL